MLIHRTTAALVALLALSAACTPGRQPVASGPAPAPAPAATDRPRAPEPAVRPAPPPGAPAIGADLLGSVRYDLPMVANDAVRAEMEFLLYQRRDVVGRWMREAERYEEFVRDVFASYGLPRDLHHLGMVESGYRPTVRSRAGAVGMWQFMPSTGRGMGLRIDSLVDERMDPVRSTRAAARHLRDLHRRFGGDWSLAAAAYNAGEGRINRGLGRYGARDFWELSQRGDLALETRQYVPRLYATTIIAKDPARFGYPPRTGAVRRFAFDSMQVDLATPLSILALIGNLTTAELAELNPHLLRQLAPRNYWVWVPLGQGMPLQLAYEGSEFRRRGGFADYRVRQGESLARIAELSGVPADQIRSLNLSSSLDDLRPGDRVRLYADAVRVLDARPVERLARAEPRVLGEPAARPSASSAGERSVTSTSTSRTPSGSSTASARTESSPGRSAGAERPSTSSAPARRTESSAGGSTRTHTVEVGETLWGIARRYEVSVDAIRDANQLGAAPIRPGQTLAIPAAPGASAAARPSSPPASSSTGGSAAPREHVVAEGETLWGIARRYETTVEILRQANDLDETRQIQPGQKLRIP